jgi:hypothetical protein
MTFTVKQERLLRQNVKHGYIRQRHVEGRELSYIEGWHVIDEANRIFGFSAWDRETVEMKCVLARDIRGQFTAVYLAKVRITVRAEGDVIVREGQGTGEAQGTTPGEAHDKALKSAETDATKRALATFGRPFGLGLYLRAVTGRSRESRTSVAKPEPGRARSIPVEKQSANRPGASANKINGAPFKSAQNSAEAVDRDQTLTLAKDGSPAPRPGIYAPGGTPPAVTGSGPADSLSCVQPELGNDNELMGIDKSLLTIGAPKRLRDKQHLLYVTTQPCLVCGRTPSDPHHLRFAQPRALGRKVSDEFTVPLCRSHHRQLHHSGNEGDWWQIVEIDPLPIAEQLWRESRVRRNAPLAHSASQDISLPTR